MNKWRVHQLLSKNSRLLYHMPETQLYSLRSLEYMINKYNNIVLKPTSKGGGAGVFKVRQFNNQNYEVHVNNKTIPINGDYNLVNYISKLMKAVKGTFIVQQYIDIIRINNRPSDMRIMVQRKTNDSPWVVTGMLAKIAGPGYFVTNHVSNHEVITIEEAFKRANISSFQIFFLRNKIINLSLDIAYTLQMNRLVGLDLAFDRDGRLWFIEANSKPAIPFFLRLKDKSMYNEILRYL